MPYYDSEASIDILNQIIKKPATVDPNGEFNQPKASGSLSKVLVLTGGMIAAILTPQEVIAKKVVLQQSDENSVNDYLENVNTPLEGYFIGLTALVCKSNRQQFIDLINSFKEDGWLENDEVIVSTESSSNAISLIKELSMASLEKIDLIYPSRNGTISVKWDNGNGSKLSLSIGEETFSYYLKINSKPKFFNNVKISIETVNQLDYNISQLFNQA